MLHQHRAVVAVLVLASISASCGESGPESAAFYEAVLMEPERIRVEPEVASPGETIEVYFPQGDDRGPGFVLERRAGEQWVWEWAISSDPEDLNPNVVSAEEFRQDRYEWNSGPSFRDEGPHMIPIPEGSEAGEYRVCTAPNPPYCASLQITEG